MPSADKMRKVVEWLGGHPAWRGPFFWSTFLTLRLIYPVQYLLLRELMGCESVLDLGCGRHSMVPILPKKTDTTGVELFAPHFEEARAKNRHKRLIQEDVTKVSFPDKSFDAAVMLDVIEHLKKEEGEALLDKMERWARKKVVVFTPNGFLDQHEFDDNPLMAHQSGWTVEDFERRGFKVYGVRGLLSMKKECFEHDHDHGGEHGGQHAIDDWKDLAQVFTYHFPKTAFQLFAVKDVSRG